MSDTSPYGTTQNADAARTTADALVGDPVPWTTGNSTVGGPALFSTAPYKPPSAYGPQPKPNRGCTGKDGTCTVPPIRGTDLCMFHTKQARARGGEPST